MVSRVPSIERVKEIIIGAAIALPIFWGGSKILSAVKDEIFPSDDDDREEFEED